MTPETPGPFVSPTPQYVPGEAPERQIADADLVWTADEQARIDVFRSQYPTPDGAVMKTLWLAQAKYGWLPPEAMHLVADTLGVPYAKVYGVATFYTQYFKEKKGTYVLDVCTCFSCQVCGGYDMLHYLEEKLGVTKGETTEDGLHSPGGRVPRRVWLRADAPGHQRPLRPQPDEGEDRRDGRHPP